MASQKKKNEGEAKTSGTRKVKSHRRRSLKEPLITVPPDGTEKMSEVLWAFVEPYLGTCKSEDSLRKLLTLALVAWNLPLMPPVEREGMIQDSLNAVPKNLRPEMLAILKELMQRKEKHFSGFKRLMFSYELTMTPDGPHLVVLSTL
jgi:hypothetical protein